MAPTSIYQSFNEAVYRPNSPDTQPVAHMSGDTTRRCEPPLFLLKTDVSVWEQLANPILRRHERELQDIFLPTRETNAVYETEGDVVAGAALELTHPVNMVPSKHVPSLLHGNEVSKGTARADKVYFKRNPSQEKIFYATLDYKRVSVISKHGFEKKIASDCTSFTTFLEGDRDNSASQEEEDDDDQDTNAENLLKQGVHYSYIYDTPFVAFFDMRTLVLLVFASREEEDGGEYAYVTVVEEPEKMRRALLGFLSLAVPHKNMGEYQWKGKIVSREQRGWFSSIGRTWLSDSRRSDRISARNP